jgi:hypothetical protein
MNQDNQIDQKKFEVRDLRQKEQYITDDKFLNGYAKFLGIYAVGVYGSLCRHANKQQRCWPSVKKICEELGVGRSSVLTATKRMEFWQIIRIYRIGKMANNRYDLIIKQRWLAINEENLKRYGEVCHINFNGLRDKFQKFVIQTSNSNETHIKELKERRGSFYKKPKPYFWGQEMRKDKRGKWWVIPKEGGQWSEFGGGKKEIEWKQ